MATIVNAPVQTDDSAGWGIFLGIIVLVLVGFFLFAYGLPNLRTVEAPTAPEENNINLNLPPAETPVQVQ